MKQTLEAHQHTGNVGRSIVSLVLDSIHCMTLKGCLIMCTTWTGQPLVREEFKKDVILMNPRLQQELIQPF